MTEPARKVDVTSIAEPFREEVRRAIQDRYDGVGPKLVAFLANKDPAARKYAEYTGKACTSDGIRYELIEVPEHEVEEALYKANDDPDVHGILVYYPVFGFFPSFYGGSMDDYLRDSVSFKKDVEGLSFTYRFNLYRNIRYMDNWDNKELKCLLPCTALSVVKILESLVYDKSKPHGERLEGKVISIINRSEIVGRPLGAMLANDGGEIYSVDIDTIYRFRRGQLLGSDDTPESAVRKSHVVVTGVPSPKYKLPSEWIQPGTVIVNVASCKNVNEEEIMQIPGVVYVPLVGKVTIAMLERNLMRLYENYHKPGAPGSKFRYYIENRPPPNSPKRGRSLSPR